MLKTIQILVLILAAISMTGCGQAPSDASLEGYKALEAVMARHVDNPEALLPAMDEVIDKYNAAWIKSRDLVGERSQDSVDHEYDIRRPEMKEAMQHIVDLDLEIQDRLKNNPQQMSAYMLRLHRIGRAPEEIE